MAIPHNPYAQRGNSDFITTCVNVVGEKENFNKVSSQRPIFIGNAPKLSVGHGSVYKCKFEPRDVTHAHHWELFLPHDIVSLLFWSVKSHISLGSVRHDFMWKYNQCITKIHISIFGAIMNSVSIVSPTGNLQAKEITIRTLWFTLEGFLNHLFIWFLFCFGVFVFLQNSTKSSKHLIRKPNTALWNYIILPKWNVGEKFVLLCRLIHFHKLTNLESMTAN